MIPTMAGSQRRLSSIAAVAALAALLGACGGGSTSHTASGSPSSKTPSATSTTPSGPSLAQVASSVAQVKATLNKLRSDLKSSCRGSSELDRFGCSLIVERAPLDGQNSMSTLQRLGLVPAEVTALMGQTMQSLQPVADLKSNRCEKNADAFACDAEIVAAEVAVDRVLQQLAGWDPYL